MAAIDFPASPTTGQLFSAANGVTYIWNGTLWLVQAGPGGGTGDFCATSPTGTFSTLATVIPLTVVSGNAGSVYSTSTGRYTPPAGRYAIYGAISGFNAGAAVGPQLQLRKNGTAVVTNAGSATSGNVAEVVVSGTFDANGTDYFDLAASAGVAVTYFGSGATFSAFPLTGMQGPMGPPFSKPTMQLDNEVVLAAPANTITVTIPANAKAIEIWFCTNNVGSANETTGLILNDVQSGAPNVGLNHSGQGLYGSAAVAGASAYNILNGWNMGGGQMAFWGVMRVFLGVAFNNMITADYAFCNAAGTHYKEQLDMYGGLPGTTGFRLQNGSGTQFIAGSYMRVFAVQ